MKKRVFISILLFILFVPAGYLMASIAFPDVFPGIIPSYPTWPVESIDTMKYSRDLAAEKLNDPTFDAVINQQIGAIAATGATHVAIATPYDPQFLPMLTRWVAAARKYKLHVWFRGNFSGWEGWFGYAPLTREQHKTMLTDFIRNNTQLFQNGDILTPCPECENGGPGDPRQTGDVSGFRQFMIDEYQLSTSAFSSIGKRVSVGYVSMNYDVALLVMDKATTKSLGGVVTIDHYVATPDVLISNIRTLAAASGGKIFLGEFGVPIPDINGQMTEGAQADWVNRALTVLSREPEVLGVNYWTSFGGTTQLWNDNGSPRQGVTVITSFFTKRL